MICLPCSTHPSITHTPHLSQAQAQGLRASFIVSQGSGSAWGPLAAQHERLRASTGAGTAGRLLRHASVDDLALPSARPASSGAGAGKRVWTCAACRAGCRRSGRPTQRLAEAAPVWAGPHATSS